MKVIRIVFCICLYLFSITAQASFMNIRAFAFTMGQWEEETRRRGLRGSLQWDWNVVWLQGKPIELTGYWEAGIGYWSDTQTKHGQNTHLVATSGSPILQIWLGSFDLHETRVFLEIGVGPAYLSHTTLGKLDLGSHWHFEDKFGVGLNFGTEQPFQLTYRYMHYSNAGLKHPNRGLDLHTLGFVIFI